VGGQAPVIDLIGGLVAPFLSATGPAEIERTEITFSTRYTTLAPRAPPVLSHATWFRRVVPDPR